jgi:peptide/nickel transport system substrate-binding protein
MTTSASQDAARRDRLRWLVVLAAIAGCESPARVKPWRHAPDPLDEATRAPRSPVLAADTASAVIAERDHTLRIAMDAEPRSLNPLIAPSIWTRRIAMGTIYETLIRYASPDREYRSGLARAWKVSPNGLEIRIELEPDVAFHDGKSMTSVDVQFTLDLIRSPRNNVDHLRWMLAEVEAVELITSRELRLRLKRPDGWVLRALAEIPILPMHVHDRDLGAGGAIVGTGPWRLASWKDGTVHLSAWARHRSPPAIADVEFVSSPDAADALTRAKRGEFDLIAELIPAHWPEQASAPGIAASFSALELAPARMRYVVFDCTAPPTDDVRVRQALGLLVDRRGLARDVYDGLARPIVAPIWPGGPIDGAAPEVPAFDPAAAARLLDDAGWIDSDKDGVRDRAGKQLRLDVIVVERATARDDPDAPPSARGVPERDRILEAWKRAGIAIDVRQGSEAVLANRIRERAFDAAFVEWSGVVDMDLSPWLASGRSENASGISSRRLDRALEAMGVVWDPKARAAHAAEIAAAFAEAMPLAPIVAAAPQGLVHRRVKGVVVWDGWVDLTRLSIGP